MLGVVFLLALMMLVLQENTKSKLPRKKTQLDGVELATENDEAAAAALANAPGRGLVSD
jgi:hypothetical protein